MIPIPPLSEQKRIAGILNERTAAIDRARAAAEAQLETAGTLLAGVSSCRCSRSKGRELPPRLALGEVGERYVFLAVVNTGLSFKASCYGLPLRGTNDFRHEQYKRRPNLLGKGEIRTASY